MRHWGREPRDGTAVGAGIQGPQGHFSVGVIGRERRLSIQPRLGNPESASASNRQHRASKL